MVQRCGSEKQRFYHQKPACMEKMLAFIEGRGPDVWHVMARTIDAEMN